MCRSSAAEPLLAGSISQLSHDHVGVRLSRWNVAASTLPYLPESMISLVFAYSGQNRMQWPTCKSLPLSLAAATIFSPSATVIAKGFSHKTLTPAFSALTAYLLCR